MPKPFLVRRYLVRKFYKGRFYSHNAPRNLGSYDDRDDAAEMAYMEWVDDPAPDKSDYYSIRVIDTGITNASYLNQRTGA